MSRMGNLKQEFFSELDRIRREVDEAKRQKKALLEAAEWGMAHAVISFSTENIGQYIKERDSHLAIIRAARESAARPGGDGK